MRTFQEGLKVKIAQRGFTPLEISRLKRLPPRLWRGGSITGFTIIELMVTIFIMTVGLTGISNLIQQTTSFIFVTSSKLTASYLTQEGIEIVRNIGDTNLLELGDYDEGLTSCLAGCIADYNHSYSPDQQDPSLPSYNNQFLNINSNGFYSYAIGSPTKFQRKITIDPTQTDLNGWPYLKISVQVSWQEKGKSYDVTAEERLYNWRQ